MPLVGYRKIAHLGTAGDYCAAGFRSVLSLLRVHSLQLDTPAVLATCPLRSNRAQIYETERYDASGWPASWFRPALTATLAPSSNRTRLVLPPGSLCQDVNAS